MQGGALLPILDLSPSNLALRLNLRIHRPEGRGDDPVLRPIYELAIHKARSVRKKFQEKRGSRELDLSVFEESDNQQEDPDTCIRGRSFSLDLPLHISQDKSEIEYIRRKNCKFVAPCGYRH